MGSHRAGHGLTREEEPPAESMHEHAYLSRPPLAGQSSDDDPRCWARLVTCFTLSFTLKIRGPLTSCKFAGAQQGGQARNQGSESSSIEGRGLQGVRRPRSLETRSRYVVRRAVHQRLLPRCPLIRFPVLLGSGLRVRFAWPCLSPMARRSS